MAKTYSLSIYAISINTRGDKNDKQILSDFNNGQDFLEYINSMMNNWKMDQNRGDQNVPVNLDGDSNEGNAFRLSRKPDGSYNLYRRGRYLSGIIETGEYGTQEEGINVTTGEVAFQKHHGEALMRPFYYMFYIPEESKIGFLIVEKISNYGIMTLLNNAIIEYYQKTPSSGDYVLKISPLSINELVQMKMRALRYEAKRIELRKVRKEDLQLSRLSGNTVNDNGVSTSIIYTAAVNSVINIADFMDRLHNLRNEDNTLYVIDEDISCDDIAITVKIGSQEKVLSLQNVQSLGMSMDISNDISLGANRYPTYESLHTQAKIIISYIIEQFHIER